MQTNKLLGRTPSPFDPKDYRVSDYITLPMRLAASVITSRKWEFNGATLDQQADVPEEQMGHCTGFSVADWGNTAPVMDRYTNKSAHSFYYQLKEIDGEINTPRKEDGSTIRAIAKLLVKNKLASAYAWATTVEQIRTWILTKGSVIVGTAWTEKMFEPNKDGILAPLGQVVGGHAYLLDEVKNVGNGSYWLFGIRNSWGSGWGLNGRAYISSNYFAQLLRQQGEALMAIELPNGSRHGR